MTKEDFKREYEYYTALKIIQLMLEKNLITEDEFREIDTLNRLSFSPLLAEIMPAVK